MTRLTHRSSSQEPRKTWQVPPAPKRLHQGPSPRLIGPAPGPKAVVITRLVKGGYVAICRCGFGDGLPKGETVIIRHSLFHSTMPQDGSGNLSLIDLPLRVH